ncbi:SPOR domain-containing protein [Helicobacter equorum]|uniref:SPOR domain-containing protein n=1 Tax=Helicobacter equorum TaxID=361872 RepID=UPI000CF07868|nr:SPOR domain-containing protein [Helicobacter equorum]
MEDKREFNDILIDDRAQYQNRSKKIMLLVVAAAVLLIILLVSAIAMSGDDDKVSTKQIAHENGLQQQTPESDTQATMQNTEFQPVQTTDLAANDRFEQIVKQIQDRQTTQSAEHAPQVSQDPILEVASQGTLSTPVVVQPTQPTKPPKSESSTPTAVPSKPIQTQSAPKQQTPQPTTKPIQVAQPTQPLQPQRQPQQVAQSTQPVANTKPAPVTQIPQTSLSVDKSRNGQVAQKGHYIQVGSFENTPNKEFLNKINNYSYRVYGAQNTTKYLVGPYQSRTDANRDILKLKTDMGDQVFYYEVK